MRINCKRPTCGKAICLLNFQKGDLRDSGNIKWRENSSVFQIGHKTPNPNHVDKNCNKKSDNPTHKILKVTEPVFLPETTKNWDKDMQHWGPDIERMSSTGLWDLGPGNRKPCEYPASTQTVFQTTVEEAVWNQERCSCAQLRVRLEVPGSCGQCWQWADLRRGSKHSGGCGGMEG